MHNNILYYCVIHYVGPLTYIVSIQDVVDILGDAVALRGELGDVYDLTVFELPGVWAQGAVSHVLAGIILPGVARACRSHLSMTRSHCCVKHGCRVIYVGFSQRRTTISTQLSFSRHCTCKVALQEPQSVVCFANNCSKFKKVSSGLGTCVVTRIH
jgi:hypothetical protein